MSDLTPEQTIAAIGQWAEAELAEARRRSQGSQETPSIRFTSERIPDPTDRRKTVYWRWYADGFMLGAVSQKPNGWRALIYRRTIDGDRITELGTCSSRQAAERAVQAWAAQNPGRLQEKPT